MRSMASESAAAASAASRRQLTRKPARRIFHSIVANQHDYQIDIAFMPYAESAQYRAVNAGHTAMLIAIETATRYAYAEPMRGKSATEVLRAFDVIWRQAESDAGGKQQLGGMSYGSAPMNSITTDDGSEFTNAQWQYMLDERGVRQFIKEPGDRFSLAVIDRAIGVIKTWLEDWQIENESLAWTQALPGVIQRFNNHTIQRLGASPAQLRQSPDAFRQAQAADVQRGARAERRFDRFEIGDTVRIRLEPQQQPRAQARKGIAKGVQRWSNAVYRIISSSGFSFELQDTAGRPALRTYRQHELMKVPDTSVDVPDLFASVAREARRARRLQREGIDEV